MRERGADLPSLTRRVGIKATSRHAAGWANAEAEILVNLGFTNALQFGAEE